MVQRKNVEKLSFVTKTHYHIIWECGFFKPWLWVWLVPKFKFDLLEHLGVKFLRRKWPKMWDENMAIWINSPIITCDWFLSFLCFLLLLKSSGRFVLDLETLCKPQNPTSKVVVENCNCGQSHNIKCVAIFIFFCFLWFLFDLEVMF